MILLPALCLAAWVAAFRRGTNSWLESLAAALIVPGVVIGIGTEVQSAAGLLTPAGSTVLWLGVAIAGGIVAARRGIARESAAPGPDRAELGELAPVAIVLTLTLFVALVAAPNSYDGLTYHLVRVERWVEQRSLAPFATSDTRQLFMPSWAEYAQLQLRLLSGGDHFANLVQWIGLAGSCLGAGLLARALGGGRTAAIVAAGLVATLPMAVSQASGVETDVVASCWAVMACAFGYRLVTGAPPARRDIVLSAAAFGLAVATKQTAALFGGVALFVAAVLLARRGRRGTAALLLVATATSIAVLAGPQLLRNRAVFGSALGDRFWVADGASTAFAPNLVAGSVLRNLAVHFGTPIGTVNSAVASVVATTSRAIGADPDDPRTTWHVPFGPEGWNTHEGSAPDPLQVLLVIGTLLAVALRRAPAAQRWFAVSLVAGFVAFCAVVRWQPYNSRLHTPLLVMALALVAVRVEPLATSTRRLLLLLVTLVALPNAVMNFTRPILTLPGGAVTPRPGILATPRTLGYFMDDPAVAPAYIDVASRIVRSGCEDVGMYTWPDAWEGGVILLVRDAGDTARFRSLAVSNPSARFMDRRAPCLLLEIWPGQQAPPAWAAGWRALAQWNLGPGRKGVSLFAPPDSPTDTPSRP